jgi:nickel superoxide dismutase
MNIKDIFNLLPTQIAYAHCDIPCGIYDPFVIQRAAHTILRMTKLLTEVNQEDDLKSDHTITRLTLVKEDHSNILEEELSTLRDDYFKKEHYEEYGNLAELFTATLKSIAKARQNIDMEASQQLLTQILEISEIFYKTKGVTPIRIKSIYPTESDLVIYK